jgi:Zn-finger domain-containing protein
MEEHGARMEASFDDQSRMDDEVERKASVIEKRMERHGAEIERIMEQRFGPEFEARIEAQAELIEGLVEDCESATLTPGETRILEQADADGEVFRLACVEGKRDRLKATETLAAIDSHPGITAAEKAAFNAAAAGERRKQVMVIRTDVSEAPELPEPPAAPEPPLAGE